MKEQSKIASMPPVRRWTPPDKRREVDVAAAVPPAAVVTKKRWTPPKKEGEENNATIIRSNDSSINLRNELEDVLRRRSISHGGGADAPPAAPSPSVYTGKRWSNHHQSDKMAADAMTAAEVKKEIPATVVYTGKLWSPLSKEETSGAIAFGRSGVAENDDNKNGGHNSSPMIKWSSSPTSTIPPTSPESDANSGSGSGGIFRSGTSNYYGVQPRDNEHTFAAVLSQKETEKKMEDEREEEMRRQHAATRTFSAFHESVVKLVRESKFKRDGGHKNLGNT